MNKKLLSILSLTVALTFSMTLSAATMGTACSGWSKNVDKYYSENDTDHAVQSLEKGFNWAAETTAVGVVISVQFLDHYLGMAAPYLFLFDAEGVLIADPIPMQNFDATTQTATHILTGRANGSSLNFLVKVAAAGGTVIFTERMHYVVGQGCDETVVEDVMDTNAAARCRKVIENGQVVIIRDGVRYNALGAQL